MVFETSQRLDKWVEKHRNEEKREEIIRALSTFDWKEYLNCIAMRKIQQFHIVDVLKQNVEGIK